MIQEQTGLQNCIRSVNVQFLAKGSRSLQENEAKLLSVLVSRHQLQTPLLFFDPRKWMDAVIRRALRHMEHEHTGDLYPCV